MSGSRFKGSCDCLVRGLSLGEGLQGEARSHTLGWESGVGRPQAPCIRPAARCPPHPQHPLFLSGPRSLSCNQARIASFLALFTEQQVEEWGLLSAPPPPSCSSPSTPSWVILLPPFSGSPHPHPGSCLPHPWLSDPFPPSPAPQGAPEAKGRRLGRERRNPHQAGNCPHHVPHPVEGRCHPQKKHLVAVRVRSLRIWEQG